ncbi:hypothetical protein SNK03_013528 [Fusarium graminearum]
MCDYRRLSRSLAIPLPRTRDEGQMTAKASSPDVPAFRLSGAEPWGYAYGGAQPARNRNIHQISSIEDVLFSIDPWLLHQSENFKLDFRLSLDVKRIRLDMRPIERVDYTPKKLQLEPDGVNEILNNWRSSMALEDEGTMFFEGVAFLFNRDSYEWDEAGRGRIAIRRPQPYLFEGFFTLNDYYYHVTLSDKYLRKRKHGDPLPPTSGSMHMVVWK